MKVIGHQVKSRPRILSYIAAYFGLVESQGQGLLHLYLLLWLCGTPCLGRIQAMLKMNEFRDWVVAFIQENVHAYVPGLEMTQTIHAIAIDKEVACQGPPYPDSLHYDQLLQRDELMLARTEQIYVCKPRWHVVLNTQGKPCYKWHAPFLCSDDVYVLETGE